MTAFAAVVLILMGLGFFIVWKNTDLVLKPDVLPNVNHPGLFGLAYEVLSFKAPDGARLKGWWVPAAGQASDKTIFLFHGWGTNSGDILPATWYLAQEGVNLFYLDFRGCGASPAHGLSSLGFYERLDAQAAIEHVRGIKPQACRRISLYGLSMGATVALYLASLPEAEFIEELFLEAPFGSFQEVITRYIRFHYKLPAFPAAWLYLYILRLRTGFADHEGVSPWRTARQCRIPKVLLVYGAKDWLALPKDGKKIEAAIRGEGPKIKTELWTLPGAGHADCFGRYPAGYREKLVRFFKS